VFPQSYLVDIIKNVRYGIPVERANFPSEWLSQKKAILNDQGQSASRTQGTGSQQGSRGPERQVNCPPGRGYEQPYGGGHYGGRPYGGQQGYQGQGRGHKEEGMAWGIINPIPTSHATPGTRAGQTNAIQKSKL
jgi:hypothetical protein